MRYSYVFAGLAALAAASDVEQLTKDTFDDYVKGSDLVLAEFFAPWCGHCKALAPEYEEAATELKPKGIKLAKIDCTEEQDLCGSYGVEGYPTLKVFRGLDSIEAYSGQRKAADIISYMTKQSLPAVSVLANDAALTEFKGNEKVVVVAYYPADDKSSNATITALGEKHRNSYPFAVIHDAAEAKTAGVKTPAVVVYRTFDEPSVAFEDKFTNDDLEAFIKGAATPLIGEVGPETYSDYMSAELPLLYIFAETEEERAEFSKDFKEIAQKHKGKVNIATIDAKAFGAHGKNLNLEENAWPAIAIQDIAGKQKYPFPTQSDKSALSAKAVGKFIDDYLGGKLKPSIKSEPIPETQDGPVTIVVADNYADLVTDNDKDVLLEFYAPWCGHCKALSPKYDELGAMYKTFSKQVTIAKVDATANDVPEEVQGFPTIMLFPANDKKNPISYSGDRSIEDLAKFVAENGSHKVAVPSVDADEEPVPTDDMPQQARAATEKAKETGEAVIDKVKDAAKGAAEHVAEAVMAAAPVDDDDHHDEL